MRYSGVISLAIVAVFCFTTSYGVSSIYGSVGPYDKIIHKEYVILKPAWFLGVVNKDVTFPPSGYVNNQLITAVRAIDQSGGKDISTGYASLSDGGPGAKHVCVHLKSARGKALNYTVEVMGH